MNLPPWTQTGWQEQVNAWVYAQLARQDVQTSGTFDQYYERPWSVVERFPTTTGAVYFKATLPGLSHEVAAMEALSRWQPYCLPALLGVDVDRGWILMPDSGARLREIIRSSRDYRHWGPILPVYAALQIGMVDHINDLVEMGIPDRRLAALPALYDQLLEDIPSMRIGQENGLTPEQYQQLREMSPDFAQMCANLASYSIPETINHGDFGDANVFLRNDRPYFIDWGEVAAAHPFFSMRTTFVSLYFSLQLDWGALELDHLRDIYLEAWVPFEPMERLRAAFKLSQRLAAISGALGWHMVLTHIDEKGREEYAHTVPSLLQEFLELGDM